MSVLDRDHIVRRPELDVRCDVVAEAHVAIGMVPDLSAIDVDGAVAHHAVELNVDLVAREVFAEA